MWLVPFIVLLVIAIHLDISISHPRPLRPTALSLPASSATTLSTVFRSQTSTFIQTVTAFTSTSFPAAIDSSRIPVSPPQRLTPSVHDDDCFAEDFNELPITVILRDGQADYTINPSFKLCSDANDSEVKVSFTYSENNSVITSVNELRRSVVDRVFSVQFEVILKALPGTEILNIEFSVGNHSKKSPYTFSAVGVAIYQDDVNNGTRNYYTGSVGKEIDSDLEISNQSYVKDFQAAVHNGIDRSLLERGDIHFNLSSNSPLKWEDGCSPVIEPDELSDRCAMGFSSNYSLFFVRFPSGYSPSGNGKIDIQWRGLADFENEINADHGVDETQPQETPSPSDYVTFLTLSQTSSRSVPKVLIVVVCLLLLTALIAISSCCWFCIKTRPMLRKNKLGAQIQNWLRGDISSLRTTAGRTVGVVEDPLSEGNSVIPTTGYGSGGHPYQRFAPPPHHIQHHGNDVMVETDHTFAPAEEEDVDGILPLERFSADKSVTKLILPREVIRGVQLDSSVDGGSDRSIGDPDDDNLSSDDGGGGTCDENNDGDDRYDTRQERDTSNTETETGTETATATEDRTTAGGTGTILVASERGASRNRSAVGAAINRVKQVDLLLGPVSRGLVGRNGEPIPGVAQPTDMDGSASQAGPDSSIMSLSTIS